MSVKVTVTAPTSYFTISSVVSIKASATSSHPITGWHIYANSKNVFTGTASSTLTGKISLVPGTYNIVVKAWDSTGAFGSATFTLAVSPYLANILPAWRPMMYKLFTAIWGAGWKIRSYNLKTITGGGFVYANGQPIANGTITFQLTAPGSNSSGQFSNVPITYQLDASGNLVAGAQILGNDEVLPSGSTYIVSVYNAQGALVYGAAYFSIAGTSPINLSNLFPVTGQSDNPTAVPQAPPVFMLSLTGGQFSFSDGSRVVNGHITFSFPFDQDLLSGGHVSRLPVTFGLDAIGNIDTGAQLFANDGCLDQDSVYYVDVYSSTGALVEGPNQYSLTTGATNYTTIDLGSLIETNGIFERPGGNTPPSQATVVVTPTASTIQVNSTQQFTAQISGSTQGVTWSVDGTIGGNTTIGTVTVNGLYTAPVGAGVHTITATLNNTTPTVSGAAVCTVQVAVLNVSVVIAPNTSSIIEGTTQQFTAAVSGTTNTALNWLVNGILGGSTGNSAGVGGTATNSSITLVVQTPIITSNSIEIKATATDTQGTITVCNLYLDDASIPSGSENGAGPFDITLSGLSAGTHIVKTVVLDNLGNTASWTSTSTIGTSNTGSITQSGLYTAPNATGVFTVTAQSQAKLTAQSNATMTVVSGISVSVAPAAFAVLSNGTQSLQATVFGLGANSTVNWTVDAVSGGNSTVGTVSPVSTTNGQSTTYTAPATTGTHNVVATSLADNTQSATSVANVNGAVNVVIQIAPTAAAVVVGSTQQFTATVTGSGDTAVIWQVNGVVGGSSTNGTISTGGLYTAFPISFTATPSTGNSTTGGVTLNLTSVTSSGTDIVLNTNASTSNAGATITSLRVNVNGGSIPFNFSGSGPWTAHIAGLSSTGVTNNSLVCTAFDSTNASASFTTSVKINAPSPATVTITAQSHADTSKTSDATVTLSNSVSTTNLTFASLINHNTSAAPGGGASVPYNTVNFPSNWFSGFNNYTSDQVSGAVYPPTAASGFTYVPFDSDGADFSCNPATPGHVSGMDVHGLVPSRPDLKWFCHVTPWFGGSNHISIGVNNNSTAWVSAFITDAINRGFDGCIIDWYGQGDTTDNVTLKIQSYLNANNPLTRAGKPFLFAIMLDGTTRTNQSSLQPALAYINSQYWSDSHYDTQNGVPVLYIFADGSSGSPIYMTSSLKSQYPCFFIARAATSVVDAVFDWSSDYTNGPQNNLGDPYNTAKVKSFLTNVSLSNSVGGMCAGFNGTLTKNTSWSLGKYLPRGAGRCLALRAATIDSNITSKITRMQWVTWNDWEEGSEVESGIDTFWRWDITSTSNEYHAGSSLYFLHSAQYIGAQISGNTLIWSGAPAYYASNGSLIEIEAVSGSFVTANGNPTFFGFPCGDGTNNADNGLNYTYGDIGTKGTFTSIHNGAAAAIDHFEIYATPDGTNMILCGTLSPNTTDFYTGQNNYPNMFQQGGPSSYFPTTFHFSLTGLAQLTVGITYTFYVYVVGIPCVRNQITNGVSFMYLG